MKPSLLVKKGAVRRRPLRRGVKRKQVYADAPQLYRHRAKLPQLLPNEPEKPALDHVRLRLMPLTLRQPVNLPDVPIEELAHTLLSPCPSDFCQKSAGKSKVSPSRNITWSRCPSSLSHDGRHYRYTDLVVRKKRGTVTKCGNNQWWCSGRTSDARPDGTRTMVGSGGHCSS